MAEEATTTLTEGVKVEGEQKAEQTAGGEQKTEDAQKVEQKTEGEKKEGEGEKKPAGATA